MSESKFKERYRPAPDMPWFVRESEADAKLDRAEERARMYEEALRKIVLRENQIGAPRSFVAKIADEALSATPASQPSRMEKLEAATKAARQDALKAAADRVTYWIDELGYIGWKGEELVEEILALDAADSEKGEK